MLCADSSFFLEIKRIKNSIHCSSAFSYNFDNSIVLLLVFERKVMYVENVEMSTIPDISYLGINIYTLIAPTLGFCKFQREKCANRICVYPVALQKTTLNLRRISSIFSILYFKVLSASVHVCYKPCFFSRIWCMRQPFPKLYCSIWFLSAQTESLFKPENIRTLFINDH